MDLATKFSGSLFKTMIEWYGAYILKLYQKTASRLAFRILPIFQTHMGSAFQEPFSQVTLKAIGDDAAPTFFEISQDGRIKIKAGANLTSDTETSYRVTIFFENYDNSHKLGL